MGGSHYSSGGNGALSGGENAETSLDSGYISKMEQTGFAEDVGMNGGKSKIKEGTRLLAWMTVMMLSFLNTQNT